jgi:cell fate regulator YaaT (PSP1 superfamily)
VEHATTRSPGAMTTTSIGIAELTDGDADSKDLLARADQALYEAKRAGGIGPCGRPLCCKSFLHSLGNVTTDLAKLQFVHGRGSERISGSCGRLMCCLAYEANFYEKELKNFPAVDSRVKTRQGQGVVTSYNIIKRTVGVRIDDAQVEVPLKDVKKI